MNKNDHEEDIEITYYTDPLCCWSWAFEPEWRRLRFEYSGKIKWRYRMCGMIPSWQSYQDPLNSVSRPLHMGPLWMEAKYVSGMPMDDKIWFRDPPSSSYPACLAVKCASLQSPEAEEWYLRYLREAVMLKGLNISNEDVLLKISELLNKNKPHLFSSKDFQQQLNSEKTNERLKEDLQLAGYHKIGRYPTLTIKSEENSGVMFTGYRPYEALEAALKEVAPDISKTNDISDVEKFKYFWGDLVERELQVK